jgi:predicted DNA-binding transcriptional regulator AlpA
MSVTQGKVKAHYGSMSPNEMLDPPELSAAIKVPEKTLAQWRYLGRGPAYVRVGRHVRYRQVDVDTWIANQTVTPGAA